MIDSLNPPASRWQMMLRNGPALFALIAAALLAVMGILAINTVSPTHAAKQTQWLVIGLVVALLTTLIHPKRLTLAAYPLAAFMLVVLAALLVLPASLVQVKGARSWVKLPFMNVQPSEFAKIAFVLALAAYLRYRDSYRTLLGLLIPFGLMFVPVFLILKQPDLGTASIFPPMLFCMLIAAGARLKHLSMLAGLALVAIVLNVAIVLYAPKSMQVLKPHQQARIRAMFAQAQGDTRYLDNIGFQQDKAITLIGSAGLWGYGGAKAEKLIKIHALPERHNDMIFVVVVNRWGWVGGAAMIALFFVLILCILTVAARTKDPFARLACIGFAAIIFSQMTINVGMTVGLLPITGITLPLVSYGGSSLLSTFIMMGLVLNFGTARPALVARPSFEFDQPAAVLE